MTTSTELRLPSGTSTSEDVAKAAQIVAAAFAKDALTRYLSMGRESRPDHPKKKDFDLVVQHWVNLIGPRIESGAILLQSQDWAGVAIWYPPGLKKTYSPGVSLSEGALEYKTKFEILKGKYMGVDSKHWYLNIVARQPGRSDKGAIGDLIRPILARAREQQLPVWLEATNEHAKDVYTYLGFRLVDTVRIGKGIVNAEGWAQEDGEGEGVILYAMLAEP